MMNSFALILILTLGTCATFASGCKFECAFNAVCDEQNLCVCPEHKPYGDPKFLCYGDGQSACYALEDPRLGSFPSDRAHLSIPCRYLLAQFDTPFDLPIGKRSVLKRFFKPGKQDNKRCRFIIEGSNALAEGGMYYVDSARVVISVKKLNFVRTIEIDLTTTTVTGVYQGVKYALTAGNSRSVTLFGSRITVKWDVATGQILILAPNCGNTKIAFRPFDVDSNRQRNRIGVAIVTGNDADFSDDKSKFPFALCDEPLPDGTTTVFKDYAKEVSVGSKDLAVLFAFLESTPSTVKQDNQRCTGAQEVFRACPAERRASAVIQCAPLLSSFLSCTGNNENRALLAFRQCQRLICKAPNNVNQRCKVLYNSFNGNDCPGFAIDECK